MSHVGLVYGHRVQNISPTWSHPRPGLLTSPGDSWDLQTRSNDQTWVLWRFWRVRKFLHLVLPRDSRDATRIHKPSLKARTEWRYPSLDGKLAMSLVESPGNHCCAFPRHSSDIVDSTWFNMVQLQKVITYYKLPKVMSVLLWSSVCILHFSAWRLSCGRVSSQMTTHKAQANRSKMKRDDKAPLFPTSGCCRCS